MLPWSQTSVSKAKGDASESVWRELLQAYLPKRYQAETAHVVDSKGAFSDQIDVVVFDRQYSPLSSIISSSLLCRPRAYTQYLRRNKPSTPLRLPTHEQR